MRRLPGPRSSAAVLGPGLSVSHECEGLGAREVRDPYVDPDLETVIRSEIVMSQETQSSHAFGT